MKELIKLLNDIYNDCTVNGSHRIKARQLLDSIESSIMERHRDNCRDYLMQVKPSDITVEDTLEALGYGRNGLKT